MEGTDKYKYRLYEFFREKYRTTREELAGKRELADKLGIESGTFYKYLYLKKDSSKELTLDKALIIKQFFKLERVEDIYTRYSNRR